MKRPVFYDKHGNKLRPRKQLGERPEPETDEEQIEALMVDCGLTDLMFDRE